MNRLLVILAALLLCGQAFAQSAVTQDGTVRPNDVAKFTQDRHIRSGTGLQGDPVGRGVNPFSITDTSAIALCANSDITTGSYNGLCLGHDSNGNGVISLTSYGLANKALNFQVNGSTYPFPFSGGGTLGPNSSTVSNCAAWNNTSGTLLSDAGEPCNKIGTANWVDQWSCSGCTITNSQLVAVLGSSGTPDNGFSPALMVQKWLGSTEGGEANSAAYFSMVRSHGSHQNGRAIMAEAYDPVGWTGGAITFNEGIKGVGALGPSAVTGLAYGGVMVAHEETTSTHAFLVGLEADVSNYTTVPPDILNASTFTSSFLASNAGHGGTQELDAYFMVNPNNTVGAARGLLCPASSGGSGLTTPVSFACVQSSAQIPYSLDAHHSPAGYGNIWLANNSIVLGSNAAGTGLKMAQIDTSDQLLLGNDTNIVNIVLGFKAAQKFTINSSINLAVFHTPATSAEACVAGDTTHDTAYIYVCTTLNTWKRATLAAF